jgi:hypothetical protein
MSKLPSKAPVKDVTEFAARTCARQGWPDVARLMRRGQVDAPAACATISGQPPNEPHDSWSNAKTTPHADTSNLPNTKTPPRFNCFSRRYALSCCFLLTLISQISCSWPRHTVEKIPSWCSYVVKLSQQCLFQPIFYIFLNTCSMFDCPKWHLKASSLSLNQIHRQPKTNQTPMQLQS